MLGGVSIQAGTEGWIFFFARAYKPINSPALPVGRGEQSRACLGRKRQGRVDEQYLLLKEGGGSGLW